MLEVVALATVTMTLEEYLALVNGSTPEPMTIEEPVIVVKKRSRSARAADKKLSAAFREANKRLRLKSGALRSGRTQADVARLAHKLRKKM